MAEEKKRVFRFIWAWQEEKEEQWLNEMARKGWMLQSYFFGIYTFYRAEPENYIYKMDYFGGWDRDKGEYFTIFQDAGWEHVTEFAGWQYFRTKADSCKYPEIYSDNASKVEKYRSLFRVMLVITLVNLINIINITHLFHEFELDALSVVRLVISMVMLFLLYADYRIFKIIRKMKRDL